MRRGKQENKTRRAYKLSVSAHVMRYPTRLSRHSLCRVAASPKWQCIFTLNHDLLGGLGMLSHFSRICTRRPFILPFRSGCVGPLRSSNTLRRITFPRPKLVVRPYTQSSNEGHDHPPQQPSTPEPQKKPSKTIRENIYTIPNLLTISRILACPILGWSIVEGNFVTATSLLVYAGLTDLVRMFCHLLEYVIRC